MSEYMSGFTSWDEVFSIYFAILNEAGNMIINWRFLAVVIPCMIVVEGLKQVVVASYSGGGPIPEDKVGEIAELMHKALFLMRVLGVFVYYGALTILSPMILLKHEALTFSIFSMLSIFQWFVFIFLHVMFLFLEWKFGNLVYAYFVRSVVTIGLIALFVLNGSAVLWPGWPLAISLAVSALGFMFIYGKALIKITNSLYMNSSPPWDNLWKFTLYSLQGFVPMIPACLYAGWFRVLT